MNIATLHHLLKHYRVRFLAFFPALSDQDFNTILVGERETLLDLLQQRYCLSRPQAKAAWNEFVLRYVDGGEQEGRLCPVQVDGARETPLFDQWQSQRAIQKLYGSLSLVACPQLQRAEGLRH